MTKQVAQECSQPFSQFLYFHTNNDPKDTSYSFCSTYSVSTIYCIVIGVVQDRKQNNTPHHTDKWFSDNFFLHQNFKISVISTITVLKCELFCQTATYLLLEGTTCCGLDVCVTVHHQYNGVCVTVHHQYNGVSNQQDATTLFINLFKWALHVSGDKFTHPQEHFWLNIQLLVKCTDTAANWCRGTGHSVCALYQKLYVQSKSAPEDGQICRPKHVGLI
jgi:hypothetical protein